MTLLQVKDLVVEFPHRRGTLRALDKISFDIAPGEILGVVGESGAGKSLTGCCRTPAFPRPSNASTTSRTSSRAACGSAW
jgi:ABC-type glutathione transport system ATPase component